MQKRERILAIMLAAVVALFGLRIGYGRLSDAIGRRRAEIETLERQVSDKRFKQAQGIDATMRLAEFEKRSLPADVDLARTLYQNWIVEIADAAKLSRIHVEPGRATTAKSAYSKLPLHLRAHGTLEQAVRFMHAFYSAPHLHQMRDVTFRPGEGPDLVLDFMVEALVLPGTTHKALSNEPGDRLAADVAEYVKTIAGRNPFAPYEPPPPPPRPVVRRPPPPGPPPFDPSKFAVLTAVVAQGGEPEAWIHVRTSGKLLKLREGDAVEIGPFRGTVARIEARRVEIEADGDRRVLDIGQNLGGAAGSAATVD
jgi:hypothetical protein